jgi:hypothetical protein
MKARPLGLAALFAVALVPPLACGGSQPSATGSFGFGGDAGAPPAAFFAAPACPPGQACAQARGLEAPLGTVYTTDPSALASLLAAAAAAGSALLAPPSPSADADPAESGLREAAAKYAPGMTPEGDVAKGTLAEGGHVGFIANLDASKCYTIVAYGAGVTDLDIHLLAPPLYNFLAAQDGMTGPAAAIGAEPRAMCPIVPMPVPYKVDLHAKKGGGPVAAQLYSRPR